MLKFNVDYMNILIFTLNKILLLLLLLHLLKLFDIND